MSVGSALQRVLALYLSLLRGEGGRAAELAQDRRFTAVITFATRAASAGMNSLRLV